MCHLCTFHSIPKLKSVFLGIQLRLLCLIFGYFQIIIPIILAILVFMYKWQNMFIFLVWYFSSIFMNIILILGVHLDFAFVCQWYYIFYMARALASLAVFVYSWVDINTQGIFIFGCYFVIDCVAIVVVRSYYFHLRDKKAVARATELAVREALESSRRSKKRKKTMSLSLGPDGAPRDGQIKHMALEHLPAPAAARPATQPKPSDKKGGKPET